MALKIDAAVETRKAELNTGRVDAALCEPSLGLYALASGQEHRSGGVPSSRIFLNTLVQHAATLAKIVSDDRGSWMSATGVFQEVFEIASQSIRDAFGDARTPDTSATVLLLRGDGAAVAHVGKTRAYCIRGGHVARLTHDHRLEDDAPQEQDEVTWIAVKPSGVGGQSLGQRSKVQMDGVTFRLAPNTVIALISEGVSGIVRGDQLLALSKEYGSLPALAAATVNTAAKRQVVADCTAVLIGLTGDSGTTSATLTPVPGSTPSPSSDDSQSKPRTRPQQRTIRRFANPTPTNLPPLRATTSTMGFAQEQPLFEDLTPAQIKAVLRLGTALTLRAGDVLCEDGSPADRLFILQQGALESDDGSRQWAIGAVFGEQAILPGARRRATIKATAGCRVLAIRGDKLLELTNRDPVLAALFYRNLARRLAERVATQSS